MSKSFTISHFTREQANSPGRINEDALFSRQSDKSLTCAVLDGASALSSITGIKRSKEQNGIFAAQTGREGIANLYFLEGSMRKLLVRTNRYLGIKLSSQGIQPEDHDDVTLSNAQVVVARINKKEETLEAALLGDVACLLRRKDGQVKLAINPDFTEEDFEALQFALDVSKLTKLSFRDVLKTNPYCKTIDEILLRGRERGNKPDKTGVGVLDGRISAKLYIRYTLIPLNDITDIALLTDGLFLPQEDPDWETMMDIMVERGIEGLYNEVTALKNSDPEFERFPRLKDHDDATGILISINQ